MLNMRWNFAAVIILNTDVLVIGQSGRDGTALRSPVSLSNATGKSFEKCNMIIQYSNAKKLLPTFKYLLLAHRLHYFDGTRCA